MAMDIVMQSPSELTPETEVGNERRVSYTVLETPQPWGAEGYRVKVQFLDGGIGYREFDHNDPTVPVRVDAL